MRGRACGKCCPQDLGDLKRLTSRGTAPSTLCESLEDEGAPLRFTKTSSAYWRAGRGRGRPGLESADDQQYAPDEGPGDVRYADEPPDQHDRYKQQEHDDQHNRHCDAEEVQEMRGRYPKRVSALEQKSRTHKRKFHYD